MQQIADLVVAGVGAGAVYGVFAVGLVLVYKTSGVLNFAQAEIGTFATFLLWAMTSSWGLPAALALPLALASAALIGVAFERQVLRPLLTGPRLTLVVATAAAASFFGGLELKLWGSAPRFLAALVPGSGLAVGQAFLTPPRLLALLVAALLGGALAWFFRRTTFGLALLALAQDPVGVRLTGIRLRHLSSFTWALSGAIGGLGAILTASALGAFAPFFMARIMLLGFAAAVVGGMASLPGALAGGLAIGLIDAAASQRFLSVPGVVEALTFAIILVMLLWRPQGLFAKAA